MGKPRVYRLEELPDSTSKEEVLLLFTESCRPHIRVQTLSRAADWNEDNRVCTATYSFQPTDNHPQPELVDRQYVIDADFYGFTPWYTPAGTIDADVIALTGLAGHAYGSWALSPERMWLRDFLASDLLRCRVLTYGYDSRLEANTSRSILFDYSNNFAVKLLDMRAQGNCVDRPVVMIGHSLGCLIIKDALIHLAAFRHRPNLRQPPPPIACLVFLGAPRQGLDTRALRTLVKGQPSEELIAELAKHSPTLTRLNTDFKNFYGDFSILTIYEKKPTASIKLGDDGIWTRDGPLVMMVEEDSAKLYWERERCIGADQDHRQIARIDRGQSGCYNQIRGFIQTCVREWISAKRVTDEELDADDDPQISCWQVQLRAQLESNFELPSLKSNKRPLSEKAHGSTCDWVFGEDAYKSWLRSRESSILWLKGPPGCGKSVLIGHVRSNLSQELVDRVSNASTRVGTTAVVLFFAFNEQFDKAQQPLHLISALLYQLTAHFPRETDALQPSQRWDDRLKDLQTAQEDSWTLFRQLVQSLAKSAKRPQHIAILVDALDECMLGLGDDVFQNLFNVLALSDDGRDAVPIKLVITARSNFFAEHQPIERLGLLKLKVLAGSQRSQVSSHILDVSQHNRKDISSYVRHQLALWSAPSAGHLLEAEIVQRAEGNFMWTVLVIDGLLRETLSSLDSALDAVRSLPEKSDLVDIYRRTLDKIPSRMAANVKSIFLFATTSSRPLMLEELADAIGTVATSGAQRLNLRKRPINMQSDVEKLCRALMSCADGLVRPTHATVTLFLEDEARCRSTFYQSKEHKHAVFARTCLKYLQFEGASKPQEDYSSTMAQRPFLQYAADNFLFHAERSPEADRLSLAEDFRSYIWHAECFSFWSQFVWAYGEMLRPQLRRFLWKVMAWDEDKKLRLPNGATPIHLLALLMTSQRMFEIVALKDGPFDAKSLPDLKDEYDQTALHWAAGTSRLYSNKPQAEEEGEEESALETSGSIISSLIDSGFDVHSLSSDSRTPLHFAAHGGRKDYVDELLKRGGSVNATDRQLFRPLHYAMIGRDLLIVQSLLKAHPEIGWKDSRGVTALHMAAIAGEAEILQALLRELITVDARDNDQLTPLHMAAFIGYNRVVRILIAEQAEVDARNEDQYTPLHLAAMNGHAETVRILIAEQASVDARDKNQMTPLHLAAFDGHMEAVQILIAKQALVNARTKDQMTPLHLAALNGHTDTVRALIARHAVVDARQKGGSTPLHMAASKGHTTTVQILIKGRAAVDARTEDQWTPLHIAACLGHTETVQALIAEHAAVDARQKDQRTVLYLASESGHVEIVRLFATEERSFMQDKYGWTAGHLSVFAGQAPTCSILLHFPPASSVLDIYGQTALDYVNKDQSLRPLLSEDLKSYTPTPAIYRERCIRRSVSTLTDALLGSTQQIATPGFHELGHCLLFLNRPMDANVSFLQRIEGITDTGQYIHKASCKGCADRSLIHGSRFVCLTCHDVDLCLKCMQGYSQGHYIEPCSEHEFFQVPNIEYAEYAKSAQRDIARWLRGVQQRFRQATL